MPRRGLDDSGGEVDINALDVPPELAYIFSLIHGKNEFRCGRYYSHALLVYIDVLRCRSHLCHWSSE